MAKKVTKIQNILGDDVAVTEEYYLNNKNLPKSTSTFAYTPKMKEEIRKCRNDIVYFAENYFFINGMYGKEIIKLFGKQKKILSTIQKNKKTLLISSRQWGKTTLMTIVAIWTALFNSDQTIAIVANKDKTAREVFSRCRLAFQQMDNWIKGGVVEFNKTFMTLANGSTIITSATSPDAIRGFSIDVLLLDEFAIIPPKDADNFWAAVTPTLSTRFNNNKHAKLIVASTPKGVGNKFHELVSDAKMKKNDFAWEEAMWSDVPGRDESFKAQEISTLGEDLFRQEYECFFLSNSNSPFSVAMFDKFSANRKEPIRVLDDGNYKMWAEPDPTHVYSIGVDSAEGTGIDYSVMQIFDVTNPLDIQQVGCYSTNSMDTMSWSLKVQEVAKQWYSPLLAVERNGCGSTPCDKLYYDWNYPRMVNFGTELAGSLRKTFRPGIISLRDLKNRAVSNMKLYISDRRTVSIYDQTTIDELRTFMQKRSASGNLKWEAMDGFHDDHVMSLCWSLFVLSDLVINEWFTVIARDQFEMPVKIEKRWSLDIGKDFKDSFYKNAPKELNFAGVMCFSGRGGNIFAGEEDYNRCNSEGDALRNLLDYGMDMPLEQYYENINLPNGMRQYEVSRFGY